MVYWSRCSTPTSHTNTTPAVSLLAEPCNTHVIKHTYTQPTGPPIQAQPAQGYLAHKKSPPLGPYRKPMPRVLGGSYGRGRSFMSEVPLGSMPLALPCVDSSSDHQEGFSLHRLHESRLVQRFLKPSPTLPSPQTHYQNISNRGIR